MRWRGVAAVTLAAMMVAGMPARAEQFGSDSTAFLKAVREADGNKATELLEKPNASTLISARDYNTGDTVLHIVVKRRDLTWLQFMIAKGAPVNAKNDQGIAPLAAAAQLGWPEGVQTLIQYGATVDLADSSGETPLILATQAHSLPAVSILVANGADPHVTDSVTGMSAIDYATRDGRSQAILKALQEAKPKPKKQISGPQIGG